MSEKVDLQLFICKFIITEYYTERIIFFNQTLMQYVYDLLSTYIPNHVIITCKNYCIYLGIWTDLPKLNPLRAQHGCALVELKGQQGVMVVGGDSGGTRLNDVR